MTGRVRRKETLEPASFAIALDIQGRVALGEKNFVQKLDER